MQQINEGNPVSLNMVNEYTDLYTKVTLQPRALHPPTLTLNA